MRIPRSMTSWLSVLLAGGLVALGGQGAALAASGASRPAAAAPLACSEAELGQAPAGANAKPMVIPTLRDWTGGNGTLSFDAGSRILVDPADAAALADTATQFQAQLKTVSGLALPIVSRAATPAAGDIVLSLAPCGAGAAQLGEEGYSLDLEDHAVLRGKGAAGVFYATQTLLQMLSLDGAAAGAHLRVTRGFAVDVPRYAERSIMFDVGRKYASVDFLAAYLRFMGWYKLNTLHLHLNDQAKAKDGSWGLRAFRLKSDKPEFAGLVPADGLVYTRDDWDKLETIAAAHHVRIVPEFDTPGHAGAFAAANPAIAYVGDTPPGGTIDPIRPATLQYVESVFGEFLPWFRSSIVHIGGDEVNVNSGSITTASQVDYLNQLGRFLQSRHKRVEMWGDASYLPRLDKSFIIQRWINWGSEASINWADKGYQWTESYGDWYIVPFGPSYFNPDGIKGDTLYAKWSQATGANAPSGGQIAVWNDNALLDSYTWESKVNDLLKDAVPAAGQVFWRGQEHDAQGQTLDYDVLRRSVATLQYGPDVTRFSDSPIPAR
ncbi:beta-N-acetylhexosaminidase [Burkholderia gladioli]|uniref:beta-N-acetylhexosaminidase n=1 Tax=Burkholderia gladioli TaxID=28095 RepID=UPI001640081C|nr:beta-N-acetylhexosaminidase [Burkholderia gladioli]